MKYRSHRYDINRPRLRHEHKDTKYKMRHSTMMVICSKQHLSNMWNSIHQKASNTEAELKKNVAYKHCVSSRICFSNFEKPSDLNLYFHWKS